MYGNQKSDVVQYKQYLSDAGTIWSRETSLLIFNHETQTAVNKRVLILLESPGILKTDL